MLEVVFVLTSDEKLEDVEINGMRWEQESGPLLTRGGASPN
jgi:hypothetical protein